MSDNARLGTYRGLVVDNNDPTAGARVTLKIPQVLGDADSNWAAPAVPTNIIPAPGDTLWVTFDGGDVTRPVYTPPGLLQLSEAVAGLEGTTFSGPPPKAPSALTLSTASVVTREGATKWLIGVEWVAPTEDQDGSVPIKMLVGYRIQYSYDGTQWAGGAFTPETSWLLDNLLQGTRVYVRVQSLSNSSGPSLWATADITTGGSAAPETPSAPTVVGQINGVRISWDGLNSVGDPMPSQFAYCQIQRSTSATNWVSLVEVGSLSDAGDFFDKSAVNGQQYFYRLCAVSKAGDRSEASAAAAATGFADPAIAAAQSKADDAVATAGDAQTTATSALNSANGKNKITFATTPPGSTPNTAGDIWFQKDANDNIVGQWEGAGGTAWVAKAISHEVISSVDAAAITVGLLTGSQIAGSSITAGHLNSVIAIISKLCSSESGRRWEADSAGIRVIDTNGATLVNLPTDPSSAASFSGDLIASSLTVTDRMAIRGVVNEISKGSKVTLSGGTTAPSSPPTVTVDWENISLTPPNSAYPSADALAYWQGAFYTVYATGVGISNVPTVTAYNSDGSAASTAHGSISNGPKDNLSLAVANNILYVFGSRDVNRTTTWSCVGYDTSWNQVSSWTYTPSAGEISGVMTSDEANNLVYCYVDSAGVVKSKYFVPSTGATPSGTTPRTSTYAVSGHLMAGWMGVADMGAGNARLWLVPEGDNVARAFDSTLARTPSDDFPLPTTTITGIAYDGTRLRTIDGPGSRLYRHAATKVGAATAKWWASMTWYDNNTTGGTHETPQGPRKSFTMSNRARLNVASPPLPPASVPASTDDVTSSRLYVGAGATDPGQPNMQQVGEIAGTTATFDTVTLPVPATLPPPTVNNFPAAPPAQINSADGTTLLLRGDGTGNVGGLAVASGGATTLTADEASVAGSPLPRGATSGSSSYQQLTTTSSTTANSNATVDIPGLSVSRTTVANRRYKITVQAHLQSTVADDSMGYSIREGTTTYFGGTIKEGTSPNQPLAFNAVAVVTPAAGSHTYSLGISRPNGTGTVSLVATASSPAFILIEDSGPA